MALVGLCQWQTTGDSGEYTAWMHQQLVQGGIKTNTSTTRKLAQPLDNRIQNCHRTNVKVRLSKGLRESGISFWIVQIITGIRETTVS